MSYALCLQSNTSYPNTENTQTIKIGLTNYDESSKDVSFHAYLPDYAEMTSFSMSTNGLSYKGKKTSHEEAHKVLQEARDRDHDAAMIAPRSMSGEQNNPLAFLASMYWRRTVQTLRIVLQDEKLLTLLTFIRLLFFVSRFQKLYMFVKFRFERHWSMIGRLNVL